jgi:hypothetical protein
MTPAPVSTIVYFSAFILISVIAGKGADTNIFFAATRQLLWYAGARLIKILLPLYSTLNFVSIHTYPECGSASGVAKPVASLHYARESVYIKVLSYCLWPRENRPSLFSTHSQELQSKTFA